MFKRNFSSKQTFKIIWFGQSISLLGTAMTRFALLIWVYKEFGNATSLALLGFFSILPFVLFSPVAGAFIDRFDRKKIMILSDLGAGVMTIIILVLYLTNNLKIVHLYIIQAFAGIFESFQLPAYSASITMLLSKKDYARASGMRSFSSSLSKVAAPMIAGFMLVKLGLKGVIFFDIITFCIGVCTLFIVTIPNPDFKNKIEEENNILREWLTGFKYISDRPGLLKLLIIMLSINLFAALTYFSILPAMILARSANNKLILASVESALGIGGVVGGLLVSMWGGPKKQIYSILFGAAASFLLGDLLFAIGRTKLIWVIAAFLSSFFIPFIMGAEHSIWQSKVDPSLQGRVFSIKGMLQQITMPLGYLLAGPLADHLFEPAMAADRILAKTFGGLVGTGKGSGMALMFFFACIIGLVISLGGYLIKDVRNIEEDIPDYELVVNSNI
jgi:MFS family permease